MITSNGEVQLQSLGAIFSIPVITYYLCQSITLKEAATVFTLGSLFGVSPGLIFAGVYWVPLPFIMYVSSVSLAHLFEYLFVCAYHPDELCWSSFLIDQSSAYVAAHIFSICEYFLELYFIPGAWKITTPSI